MSNERYTATTDLRDEVFKVGEVIHKVVVAAGADAITVAMAAQVRGDDVVFACKPSRDDRFPRPRQIEKSVHKNDGVIDLLVIAAPFQKVVAQAGRKRNTTRHGQRHAL